jgi:hypothetical protein
MGKLILLFTLFLAPLTSNADYQLTSELVQDWKAFKKDTKSKEETLRHGMYIGYVWGVIDSCNGRMFVIPNNAKSGQLFHVVGKWLEGHPEEWHKEPQALVVRALQDAFPK